MNKCFLSAALAGGLFLSAPLHAETGAARVKIGTLSCHEKSGWGFVFGSSHALQCTFSNGDKVEHYDGSISKFGVDIGYQLYQPRAARLTWAIPVRLKML